MNYKAYRLIRVISAFVPRESVVDRRPEIPMLQASVCRIILRPVAVRFSFRGCLNSAQNHSSVMSASCINFHFWFSLRKSVIGVALNMWTPFCPSIDRTFRMYYKSWPPSVQWTSTALVHTDTHPLHKWAPNFVIIWTSRRRALGYVSWPWEYDIVLEVSAEVSGHAYKHPWRTKWLQLRPALTNLWLVKGVASTVFGLDQSVNGICQ